MYLSYEVLRDMWEVKLGRIVLFSLVSCIFVYVYLQFESVKVQCQGENCFSSAVLSYFSRHGSNTKPDEILRMVKRRNDMRSKFLQQACYRLNLTSAIPDDDQDLIEMLSTLFYYSDKHKVVACLIPKTGCTNFKRVLLTAEGISYENQDVSYLAKKTIALRLVQNVTEIRRKLKTYYKITIVREPLYRLLSAFRNKVRDPIDPFFRKISYKIHNIVTHSHERKTATFLEFMSLVTSPKYKRNNHWQFFHKLCMPCTFKYDFIGHLETIDNDFLYLKKAIGLEPDSTLRSTAEKRRTSKTRFEHFYSGIPASLVKKAITTYRTDYELFGFGKPSVVN